MKVFITGSTGLIGSAIINELVKAGVEVHGLVRSQTNADRLVKLGGVPVLGNITDTDLLAQEAVKSDGVIHLAFMSPRNAGNSSPAAVDQKAITAMGDALINSNKPFIITSAIGELSSMTRQSETDRPVKMTDPALLAMDRGNSEEIALAFATKGVRSMVVRPAPSVHIAGKGGFIRGLITLAQSSQESDYVTGNYHWASVHLLDLAHLYVLALNNGQAGHVYHGIAEEVALKDIATTIGEQLKVPVKAISPAQAGSHFGWLTPFVSRNIYAESSLTQNNLNWHPEHTNLLTDLTNPKFYED